MHERADDAAGLAEGREEAFAALYDRYAPALYRVALALLRSRTDAEDAVQEVFLGLVRAQHRAPAGVQCAPSGVAAVPRSCTMPSLLCPRCRKKWKGPEGGARGLRCPQCGTPLQSVSDEQAAVPAPRRAVPSDAGMRCAACKARALQELPPNVISWHPGYSCAECGAVMRRPGGTSGLIFALVMGAFGLLLGIFLLYATTQTNWENKDGPEKGAIMIACMGLLVILWACYQLRLREPLDAPPRPSRLWIWLTLLVVGLLAGGGCVVGFLYFLHEML